MLKIGWAAVPNANVDVPRPRQGIAFIGCTFTTIAFLALISGSHANAQTCSGASLPYTLTNGATADANQVMADLSCAGIYSLAHAGNVGIGTTAPDRSLVIAGSHPTLGLYDPSGSTIALSPPTSASGSVGEIDISGANDFRIDTNATERLRVDSSGNVDIATAGPAANLTMHGNIVIQNANSLFMDSVNNGYGMAFVAQGDNNFVMYSSDSNGNRYPVFAQYMQSTGAVFNFMSPVQFGNSVYGISDVRLKKNIQTLTGGLAIIQNLRPVTYDWRAASERSVGKKLTLPLDEHQMGFIAQELQKVLPDAVRTPTEPDGVYAIKEQNLIPVLVEALKEQQAEIVLMQAKITALEAAH